LNAREGWMNGLLSSAAPGKADIPSTAGMGPERSFGRRPVNGRFGVASSAFPRIGSGRTPRGRHEESAVLCPHSLSGWIGAKMTKWKPVKIEDHEHTAWCEIRPHSDGTLDELVVSRGATVHIEQMESGRWWLAIDKDGERQVVWFESTSRIHAWTTRE
jgi:hypothetical protein